MLAQIESSPSQKGKPLRWGDLFRLVDDLMHYARKAGMERSISDVALIDELDRVVFDHTSGTEHHWTELSERTDGLLSVGNNR